jgi:hypothetical protein
MNNDARLNSINQWLITTLGTNDFQISAASSDASFRRYFRVAQGDTTYILMDAPPEHEELAPFVQIAKLLQTNGVNVPKVYNESTEHGFLLLTDFGNQSLLSVINQENSSSLYQLAINELINIQKIKSDIEDLPCYDSTLLSNEMSLFSEWFLNTHLKIETPEFIGSIFDTLISNAVKQPQVLVHRDYHSRNLMVIDNQKLGVIDFQDAVLGPISYDLVSIFRDCYILWPEQDIDVWLNEYLEKAKLNNLVATSITFSEFKRWFDLMGLQRHIKVLGIFCRLYYRDGKPNYLDDLPLTLHYVLTVASRYPEFSKLVDFLQHPKIQAIL